MSARSTTLDGFSLSFNYAAPGNGIAPGDATDWILVKTNATNFDNLGQTTMIDGATGTVTSFEPARTRTGQHRSGRCRSRRIARQTARSSDAGINNLKSDSQTKAGCEVPPKSGGSFAVRRKKIAKRQPPDPDDWTLSLLTYDVVRQRGQKSVQ